MNLKDVIKYIKFYLFKKYSQIEQSIQEIINYIKSHCSKKCPNAIFISHIIDDVKIIYGRGVLAFNNLKIKMKKRKASFLYRLKFKIIKYKDTIKNNIKISIKNCKMFFKKKKIYIKNRFYEIMLDLIERFEK